MLSLFPKMKYAPRIKYVKKVKNPEQEEDVQLKILAENLELSKREVTFLISY